MQYGTPYPHCQICKRTIQPHDLLTFQDGNLFHARCVEQRTQHCIKAERHAEAFLREKRERP
jgi:hypothetical protein